jgi:hypothetical protein
VSRRRKALPSLLRSCKSRTLFSGTHRHTQGCSCPAMKSGVDSGTRPAKGYTPTPITRETALQWFQFYFSWACPLAPVLLHEVSTGTDLTAISTSRELDITTSPRVSDQPTQKSSRGRKGLYSQPSYGDESQRSKRILCASLGGAGFQTCGNALSRNDRALQGCGKSQTLKRTGFSPYVTTVESTRL